MRYGMRDLEVADIPDVLHVGPGEEGLALVLRDRGALVGFRMIEPASGTTGIPASAIVDEEVRQGIVCEKLRRAASHEAAPPPPNLSVVICSKDRWDWVERLLASLELVRGGPCFEILVIDNAPTDDRMRDVCRARGVRYVREPLVGLDFARNRGVREATGDVVAFLDDDVVVDRNWLDGMRGAWARNPDAGCITGLVLPLALDTQAQILFERRGGFRRGFLPRRFKGDAEHDPLFPCGAGQFGAGANMSVRRSLVLALGGFDEALDTGRPLPGGGDLDIFYRVLRSGAALVYEPQAAVFHEHRRELAVLRRQYYTWGVGFSAYIAKSMRADPPMSGRFRRLLVWWFGYQALRVVRRAVGREPTPLRMILVEMWGGVVGLAGEYDRSRSRIADIRGTTPA